MKVTNQNPLVETALSNRKPLSLLLDVIRYRILIILSDRVLHVHESQNKSSRSIQIPRVAGRNPSLLQHEANEAAHAIGANIVPPVFPTHFQIREKDCVSVTS